MNRLFLPTTPLAKQNKGLSRSWYFDKNMLDPSAHAESANQRRLSDGLLKEGKKSNLDNHQLGHELRPQNFAPGRRKSVHTMYDNSATPDHRSASCEQHRAHTPREAETPVDQYEIQKQILKAKAEAKTVSSMNGDLYIDYKFVAHLPPGMRV